MQNMNFTKLSLALACCLTLGQSLWAQVETEVKTAQKMVIITVDDNGNKTETVIMDPQEIEQRMGHFPAINSDKPFLGVVMELEMSRTEINGQVTESSEVRIQKVIPGSAAEAAGLQAGDILVAMNGQKIENPDMLGEAMQNLKVGDQVSIQYKRGDNVASTNATLKARTAADMGGMAQKHIRIERDGNVDEIRIEGFENGKNCFPMGDKNACHAPAAPKAQLGISMGFNREVEVINGEERIFNTVTVEDVVEGSAAAEAGLKAGDIIWAINETEIKEPSDVSKLVSNLAPGTTIGIRYERDGTVNNTTATLKAPTPYIAMPERQTIFRDNAFKMPEESRKKACAQLEEMQQQAFIGVYLNGKSLVVSEVIPNTAAARNNMQVNDQLTKLGKTSINNYDELLKALSNYKAGDRVKIDFLRNGQTERKNIVLGSLAEGQAKTASLLKSMCEDGQEKDQTNIFPEAMPNSQLSAFPNPSAGQFKVQFESSSKAPIAISISDMSGREVYKADISQFNGTVVQNIDLRNEAKGLYIINVRQDGKLSSQKISLF